MSEPKRVTPDPLEFEVAQAIDICDGDVIAALRSALVVNFFLLGEVERQQGRFNRLYPWTIVAGAQSCGKARALAGKVPPRYYAIGGNLNRSAHA